MYLFYFKFNKFPLIVENIEKNIFILWLLDEIKSYEYP